MHIGFVSSWWTDRARGSGTAASIHGLATGLRGLGHEVTLLQPRQTAHQSAHQTVGHHLLERLLYNLRVPRLLRRNAFDLVVGFDWDGFVPHTPPHATPHAPYVVCLKGTAADELRFERGWTRLRMSLKARLEASNARRADRVVAPSRYSRDVSRRMYGLGPGHITTVPEGIHLAEWAAQPDQPRAMAPTILSVARQYPRKNTGILLRAMPEILRRVPEARLEIIGDGPRLPALRRLAQRLGLGTRVCFRGALSDAQVRAAYGRAHVFCLPSRQEAFGIAFLEAMAAGLPVVAADAGAAPELVHHDHTGLLVPPDDISGLADAVATLLANPPHAHRLGRAGRRRAEDHDWQQVAARFLGATL